MSSQPPQCQLPARLGHGKGARQNACGRREAQGGQEGDRMLAADISRLELPKSCWRAQCLHLCSKGWQALHCVRLLHSRLTFAATAAWQGQLRRSSVLWGGTFLFCNRAAAASLLSKILEWYLGLDQAYSPKPRQRGRSIKITAIYLQQPPQVWELSILITTPHTQTPSHL